MEVPKKEVKKPRGKYDDKLKVKGTLSDLMKAAAKDANAKAVQPKEAVNKRPQK